MFENTMIDNIKNHWSNLLGYKIGVHTNNVIVVPHSDTLNGYQGAFIVNILNQYIISVPINKLEQTIQQVNLLADINLENVKQLFSKNTISTIGPAWLGYADTNTFCGESSNKVIELNEIDNMALIELSKQCIGDEWKHSDIELDRKPILGIYDGENLIAAGSYRNKGQHILSVGIITHPRYRGRGYGRKIVSQLSVLGLYKNAIMEYQTLESNVSSVGLAKSLGYRGLVRTMSVRFK